jgi:phosphoglycolate phosphatase
MASVFLDLDGTLTDPKVGITQSVIYALNQLGLTAPHPDELEWVIGPALLDSFARLGAPDPQAALDLYRTRYTRVGLFENLVYPGIPSVLEKLVGDGHTLYLATAKPHAYATKITAHLGLSQWLRQEFGPELDGTRNNKGDLLQHALATTGINPNHAVMIGDRVHDFNAARFVKMRSVGVTWGYGGCDEIAQATVSCDAPAGLPDAIQSALTSALTSTLT